MTVLWALSGLSAFGFAAILVLCWLWPRIGRCAFWPHTPGCWQTHVVRALFCLGLIALVVLSVWMIRQAPVSPPYAGQGAIMLGLGFGMALRIMRAMGWANALGTPKGLITTGWFARSRNPITLATWVGLVGLALLVPEPEVLVPLALWAALCGVAPFLEEPWLRKTYGAAYDAYAAKVPRFF